MPVFKTFMKSALRFMPQTIIYFAVFTVIALFFANFQEGGSDSKFRTAELSIGVIDKDNSAASEALKGYLETMHTLYPLTDDSDSLPDRLFYRDVDYILSIPKQFEEKLAGGDSEGLFESIRIPGIYSSAFIDGQIHMYLKTVKLALIGGSNLKEAMAYANETLKEASGHVSVLETKKEGDALEPAFFYAFCQFMAYVLVAMILSYLTPMLTIFWSKDISRRTACSSVSPASKNLQLALGSIVYSLGIWLLFLLTAGLFDHAAFFSRQGFFCVLNSFLLIPLAIAISLIISSFSPSSNAISMATNTICLGMSFLCGVFVPQQLLGENVLAVSKFLPAYWYIKNNDMIFGVSKQPFQIEIFWQNMGMQALFAAAAFSVALVLVKYKNQPINTFLPSKAKP